MPTRAPSAATLWDNAQRDRRSWLQWPGSAHLGLVRIDLGSEVGVCWIDHFCLLPSLQRLRNVIQFQVDVAQMLEDDSILARKILNGALQSLESLIVFTLAILHPSHAIEIRPVSRLELER